MKIKKKWGGSGRGGSGWGQGGVMVDVSRELKFFGNFFFFFFGGGGGGRVGGERVRVDVNGEVKFL